MRLQHLEINGFKSFSDRSELAFDQGVTAIVGPNGCGKSNVADAITWVMGEQSAKSLRGERMEDVIFSGSDARKPTATAEVRLRFSGVLKNLTGPAFPGEDGNGHSSRPGSHSTGSHGNGNGNGNEHGATGNIESNAEAIIQSVAGEVEVTRRLYRSGDSEYLIDGHVCRLRDVHDLLMDTGLGAKAYAIIEQGKIGLILSSRPTDRRQLIEEAAGVTKYKSRRRAAELKLEAAQQNLTRVEDIVFEVEKQRGMLKRQAGKARRYQKLRDRLRSWEKVLFARKYRQLAATIESGLARLIEARDRESAAAARVAAIDSDLGRLRIELVEAESRATAARSTVHSKEIAINRHEQQMAFDREQIASCEARAAVVAAELETLEARREPVRTSLSVRREAMAAAAAERARAEEILSDDSDAYDAVHREIEGLEADVEAARSEVFSAINSATALRHAIEHAAVARDRVAETLTKLDVEIEDVRIESERVAADHAAAAESLRRTQHAIDATRVARSARESELASARIEHEWRDRLIRAQEHELAGLAARLKSLEELQAARAGYADAARAVLTHVGGQLEQHGAVADYLEVEAGYERAAEACLGDLLQHVIVESPKDAAAGFQLVREGSAGRCGFVIVSVEDANAETGSGVAREDGDKAADALPEGVVTLSSVVRVNGPYADVIRVAMSDAWITDTFERAAEASHKSALPVATRSGDVFSGPHVVSGGIRDEGRGILETNREIKELRERLKQGREALVRLSEETARFEASIAEAGNGIAALNAEHHRQEKALVAHEAQLRRAAEETARFVQKNDQLVRERGQAEDEREALDRRQEEARISIVRLEQDQRIADDRFSTAQRRLFEAREAAEDLNRRAAETRAAHAALVERATALEIDVQRLEEAAAELESRAAALAGELEELHGRGERLVAAIVARQAQLDADTADLAMLHREVMAADDAVVNLRTKAEEHEGSVKEARSTLESVRSIVAQLEIARATAESDLSHLAQSCFDAVQATLDEVMIAVESIEQNGGAACNGRDLSEEDTGDSGDDNSDASAGEDRPGADRDEPAGNAAAEMTATAAAMTAEEAISQLRAKIDRLGPVNMMAIEQFDELETRHAFLTSQRKDLVDSIAQTSEAIRRIDQTTRQRFADAFSAINHNFQETFSTLFGGGRAGLTLLDENDPLESGIEIIAQPPGKRLQSVQLLSGGEKALTAIALMFGLFKYKPSPFCLLDEIDAPLDDANIGRFVEMLRGMQQHTQFILITHNRKTMEIADRLYGVTMEEPGVSKLISVQLN